MNEELLHYAMEAGLSESEAKPLIFACENGPITVDQLIAVGAK